MTKEEFEKAVINMTVIEAQALGAKYKFNIRATTVNGVGQIVTMEYRTNRLNVYIVVKDPDSFDYDNGLIVAAGTWG